MAASYATLAEFKAAIDVTDTNSDVDLQRSLDAATEWINHYTGRTFYAAGASSSKYFLPREPDKLSIPDVQSVTILEIDVDGDGTFKQALAPTEYTLLPLEDHLGGYTLIVLNQTAPYWFVVGYQARVTGTWGYGTTPPSVKQACILLANRYFQRPSAPFGVWEAPTTGELGRVQDLDPDVQTLLSAFVTEGGSGSMRSDAWVMV